MGPLPEDEGKNCILSMTDRLHSDIWIVTTQTDITANGLACLFFDHWYCENGLLLNIVSDRDKLFLSAFWKALHRLMGVKIKMSSAYHPETDGASEWSNKTINQMLRYHVDRDQKGWVCALLRVRFAIMSTVNRSTGFTPFFLRFGRSPRILPPLVKTDIVSDNDTVSALRALERLETNIMDAKDNLLKAKIAQSIQSNKQRWSNWNVSVDDKVLLNTKNHRREYMQTHDGLFLSSCLVLTDHILSLLFMQMLLLLHSTCLIPPKSTICSICLK